MGNKILITLIMLTLAASIISCGTVKKTTSIKNTTTTKSDSISTTENKVKIKTDSVSFKETVTRKDTVIKQPKDNSKIVISIDKKGKVDVIDEKQGKRSKITLTEKQVGKERIVIIDCDVDSAGVAFSYFETHTDVFSSNIEADTVEKIVYIDKSDSLVSDSIETSVKRSGAFAWLKWLLIGAVSGGAIVFTSKWWLPMIRKILTGI